MWPPSINSARSKNPVSRSEPESALGSDPPTYRLALAYGEPNHRQPGTEQVDAEEETDCPFSGAWPVDPEQHAIASASIPLTTSHHQFDCVCKRTTNAMPPTMYSKANSTCASAPAQPRGEDVNPVSDAVDDEQ